MSSLGTTATLVVLLTKLLPGKQTHSLGQTTSAPLQQQPLLRFGHRADSSPHRHHTLQTQTSNATTSTLCIGSLNGPLYGTNGVGLSNLNTLGLSTASSSISATARPTAYSVATRLLITQGGYDLDGYFITRQTSNSFNLALWLKLGR
jgi:hypothetical protein